MAVSVDRDHELVKEDEDKTGSVRLLVSQTVFGGTGDLSAGATFGHLAVEKPEEEDMIAYYEELQSFAEQAERNKAVYGRLSPEPIATSAHSLSQTSMFRGKRTIEWQAQIFSVCPLNQHHPSHRAPVRRGRKTCRI